MAHDRLQTHRRYKRNAQSAMRAEAAVGPNVSRATLPLLEGIAALEIPDRLSPESLKDLKDWMEVMMRRAERVMKRTQNSVLSDTPIVSAEQGMP
jgi:hypothetical protein